MPDIDPPVDPITVYGVDFSAAARDAGAKTWVATGTVVDGELRIESVDPLVEFADHPSADRDGALQAVAEWIQELDERAIVGLDFPFGLPRFIVEAAGIGSWREFINGFPDTLINSPANADTDDPVRAFAERCVELTRAHGEGTYDKRETDRAVGARSPYGFIADTITFYGIRDVLAPVIDDVRVAPMDSFASDGFEMAGPTLVETYPAAVFDALGLCRTNYKGSSDAETTRRRRNAEGLTAESGLVYQEPAALVDRIVDNDGGDALDAVAACLGAYRAFTTDYAVGIDDTGDPAAVALEGYIYALRGH